MNTANDKMKVQIWSDVMCPFCYIGKRHFEEALQGFGEKEMVEIEWKSFQLDPTMPEVNTGEDVYEYLMMRKGISKEQVKQMHTQVTAMAADAGLDYHLDKTPMVNSFKAHRLIQLAKEKGLGDEAEETLFYANFTLNRDFSDDAVLVDLGKQIGLPEADVKRALADAVYEGKVKRDIYEAQTLSINGVPFFVFDGKYGVSGAQPAEVLANALQQSVAEWKGTGTPLQMIDATEGEICDVDGGIVSG